MAEGETLRVEPLGPQHDRTTFDCGEPHLNRYLREQATQDIRRQVARVYVAGGDAPSRILGFYSLSAAAFQRDDLSPDEAKRLPRYPVPAALIGRLAVDRVHAGRGIGSWLLIDAVERVLKASETLAIHAIIVDAKSADVKPFYERYGFKAFPRQALRMYLPTSTAAQAFAALPRR